MKYNFISTVQVLCTVLYVQYIFLTCNDYQNVIACNNVITLVITLVLQEVQYHETLALLDITEKSVNIVNIRRF